ncbi:MAG: DNA-formamidopyrimidine glycosylase family protein [Herbiconiux sp.]|nr:DNA-formamidopyrimidine glycosylase family protein [Herbiconiux sp.]
MPELPEVTALVADLGARLAGRTVERFDVVSFAALKTFDPPASALAGRVVQGVARHGKFLDIALGAPDAAEPAGGAPAPAPAPGDAVLHVVMHLARAGWIRWREGPPPPPSGRPGSGPLAARLVLADDGLGTAGAGLDITEAGSKKSLALYVVRDPAEVPGVARLGPDPLAAAFTEAEFARILSTSGRAQIKGVLRDQSKIAGIGNAYSDEILHAARMSPFKPAAMPEDDVAALYAALQSTLREAVTRADGLAASELKREKKSGLQVHGRTGEACPVCGDTVRQVTYADSSLKYCPTCQTGGKPLADRVLSRLLK